ncbi:MAG: hypothetical protein KIT09_14650 [Bryobacteraceae bacterium]|nr:hypothetical protein [Bryobacteraceae bacterium]
MLYLISQILTWMLLAFAAGLILGWPLWGRRLRRELDESKRRAQKTIDSFRDELAHGRARLRQLETQCDALRGDRMEADRLLLEARAHANWLEGETEKLKAEAETSAIRLQSLAESLTEKESQIAAQQERLAALEAHITELELELQRRGEEAARLREQAAAQAKPRRRRPAAKLLPELQVKQLQVLEPPA